MDIGAKKQLREQSADFLKAVLRQASQKESPAVPESAVQDVREIEEITNKLKDKFKAKSA